MSFIGTAVLGSAVIGAGASIYGSSKAADAQTAAANKASQIAQDQYQQNRSDFAPYRNLGTDAAGQMTSRLSDLTAPIKMDQATLEQTPGYQFNLEQGLKATQNSAAARGLGVSGAAFKGAAKFATGLADSTYQNQFNNANTNQSNAYNRLKGLIDTGAGSANNTAASGTNASIISSNAATQAGSAQAAAANLTGQAISTQANNLSGFAQSNRGGAYLQGLYGGNGTNNNAISNYNSGSAVY